MPTLSPPVDEEIHSGDIDFDRTPESSIITSGLTPPINSEQDKNKHDLRILLKYLENRWVVDTMETELKRGIIPNPKEGFPFICQTDSKTHEYLKEITTKLLERDKHKRTPFDATGKVKTDLNLSLEFLAELEESHPTFLGMRQQTQ